jgi:ABC-type glycerol-3-phosphate transport system substrate-binding protein
LEGISLSLWHPWSAAAADELEALVSDFNRTNTWGIRVETRPIVDFDELLMKQPASGEVHEKPDILISPLYQLLYLNRDRSWLTNLDDYVQDPTWGLTTAKQADFLPVFWQHGFEAERRVAVPALSSGSVIYYNQTWANELGFSRPPSTSAQFEEQACAAARANQSDNIRENDSTGGWIINTSYPAAISWLYAYGAEIQDAEDGYLFNVTPVRQSLAFLRNLYEQGCAWLPEDEFIEDEFASRRGLFASGTVLSIPLQEDAFANARSQDEWMVLPYPGQSGPGAVTVYGESFAVITSTPQRQLASWLFIRWMLQPENQARLILKTGAYPLGAAALAEIRTHKPLKQWQQAVRLLDFAHSEPGLASWRTVRWAVSDVTTQLFRWYFTLDQLPASVRLLDQTAAELHLLSIENREDLP